MRFGSVCRNSVRCSAVGDGFADGVDEGEEAKCGQRPIAPALDVLAGVGGVADGVADGVLQGETLEESDGQACEVAGGVGLGERRGFGRSCSSVNMPR